MSLDPSLYSELLELLEAVCRGDATAANLARLEELVGGDPDARAFYVDYLDIHAQLRWSVGALEHAQGGQQQAVAGQVASGPPKPHVQPAGRSPVLGFLSGLLRYAAGTPTNNALAWFVMAVVCSGMVLTLFFCIALVFHGVGANVHVDGPELVVSREHGAGSTEQGARSMGQQARSPLSPPSSLFPAPSPQLPASNGTVARLIHCYDCRWAIGSHSPHLGDDLESGRKLVLLSGLAEIMFQSGVRAVLQGPATMEVGSRTSALLRRGKLTVRVEDPDAHGFEVDTPGMKYTDLGTEFGVSVAKDGTQEMVVFSGKVQAETIQAEVAESLPSLVPGRGAGGEGSNPKSDVPNPQSPAPGSKPIVVKAHEAIHVAAQGKPAERVSADGKQFVRPGQVMQAVADSSPDFQRWKAASERLRKDASLVAYYDFQPDDGNRTVLRNRAASGEKLDGRIEGATWAEGHLPGKSALEFSGSGDRVRVDIPGRFEVLTAAAWVKIERLPADYSGILMSDGWFLQVGQCHWTLRSDGEMSLRPCHAAVRSDKPPGFESGSSGTVLRPSDLGAWCHVAVVYDSRMQTSVHYRDGRVYGTQKFAARIPLVFGPSQIANWESESNGKPLFNNVKGRVDELLLLERALSSDEIKTLYENSSGTAGTDLNK